MKILYNLEFNSVRKRQSIIYEMNNRIYISTKGADSIMLPRLLIDN